MVLNLLRRAEALSVRLRHRSRAQHHRKNQPEIFCSSLLWKLGTNLVKVFEHFHPALGPKSIGLNDGVLNFRRDLLTIADQPCQLLIGLGDARTHQRAFRLIFLMDPLDASRLLIIQGKL